MAAWPELDELKQVLNVDSDDWDGDDYDATRLTRLLAAAIAKTKQDIGGWDEDTDEPDEMLAQAALRMAELMALRPGVEVNFASQSFIEDPTYTRLLYGHRKTFPIS